MKKEKNKRKQLTVATTQTIQYEVMTHYTVVVDDKLDNSWWKNCEYNLWFNLLVINETERKKP